VISLSDSQLRVLMTTALHMFLAVLLKLRGRSGDADVDAAVKQALSGLIQQSAA
jgi:hypothetical protein